MESWMGALTAAIMIRLAENTEAWGSHIYKDQAPIGRSGELTIPRPYVIVAYVGGGNVGGSGRFNWINTLWQVKVVANTDITAYAGAARISQLLQNADFGTAKVLNGGTDWIINTVMEDRAIDMSELIDGNRIYHAGHVFRVQMSSKGVI